MGVFNDDGGELGEVFRNLWCAICHDEDVLGAELVEELSVAVDAGEEGLGAPFRHIARILFLGGRSFLLGCSGEYLVGGLAILLFLSLAACLGDEELWVGARATLIAQVMGSIETALFPGCSDGDSHLGPESEFVLGALFQAFGDEFDAGDDFFEENLED